MKKEMAKVILEFDPIEESQDLRFAIDGMKWWSALYELDQHLRGIVKYSGAHTDEELAFAESIREKIREITNDNNLILDL
jgi:hypothetical protein